MAPRVGAPAAATAGIRRGRARALRGGLPGRGGGADRVRQPHTHTAAAFYERYPAAEARRLAERVEFVYTPVHGSWLNVVECEFSAMVRQCIAHRRLGEIEVLRREIQAWVAARNGAGAKVEWQFTMADARIKLKRLYPSTTT